MLYILVATRAKVKFVDFKLISNKIALSESISKTNTSYSFV